MKKLNKLKLRDVAVLSDGEMKNVVGGASAGDAGMFACFCMESGSQGSSTPTILAESELATFCSSGIADCHQIGM